MHRQVRCAVLLAALLLAVPLAAGAEAPAAPEPTETEAASGEVSIAELEELLDLKAPEEKTCDIGDNCAGCGLAVSRCACECYVEAHDCQIECGGTPSCVFACNQVGQECANCCYGMGH
jgi:hypothetical protein